MDFKIIDSHMHFQVKDYDIVSVKKDYIEKYGAQKYNKLEEKNKYQSILWRKAWGFPDPEPAGDNVKETAKRWIGEMDKYNLERLVFVTGGGNQILSQIINLYPDKFIGYAHHNPFSKNADKELEHAVKNLNLKGYKILAPDLKGKLDDPSLNSLWDVAEKYQLPVLIHFGIMGAAGGIADSYNINPMVIHDVARTHPDIPFIIPHFGCGHPEQLLQLAWVCPNVYVDTTGSNQWTRWMPYPLTVKDLFKKFYETVGPERIIFGTDSEWFPRGFVKRYLDDQLRDCYELGMKEEEIKCIFRDNIAGLLKI
jgi:uncharacterized protein